MINKINTPGADRNNPKFKQVTYNHSKPFPTAQSTFVHLTPSETHLDSTHQSSSVSIHHIPVSSSQRPCKGNGTCPVCLSVFKTKSLDGTLHNHDHRNAPCHGSNRLPLIIDADVLSSTEVINIPDSTAGASFEESTDSTHPSTKVTKSLMQMSFRPQRS